MFVDGVVGRNATFRAQPRNERTDAARAADDAVTGGGRARGCGRQCGCPPCLPLAAPHLTPRVKLVFLHLMLGEFFNL